jgi:hypothetical protein
MTSFPFGIFLALFAAVWLSMAVAGGIREFAKSGRMKWVVGSMTALVLIGAGGFFASGLVAMGTLKLPNSFQWAAGDVSGVVMTPEGNYVVPLEPTGRIQLYGPQWKFLSGWQVDAEGGDFRVRCTPDRIIHVLTGRGKKHYSFTQNGDPISDDGSFSFDLLPNGDEVLPAASAAIIVPTSPLLWVFSSPFFCWILIVIGTLGIKFATRSGLRNVDTSSSSPQNQPSNDS